MKLILGYLLSIAGALTTLMVAAEVHRLPAAMEPLRVVIICAALGGLGGCVYCLRGVYLNRSVRRQWDDAWQVWYYIRPLVSTACGAISYLFLRAGLLVLESGQRPGSTDLGFYALAFIAGLNVDKFIVKIEDIAQAVWGIEKSRAASESSATSKEPT